MVLLIQQEIFSISPGKYSFKALFMTPETAEKEALLMCRTAPT
jgi:hypothetical protein